MLGMPAVGEATAPAAEPNPSQEAEEKKLKPLDLLKGIFGR